MRHTADIMRNDRGNDVGRVRAGHTFLAASAVLNLWLATSPLLAAGNDVKFDLVPSTAGKTCLPQASGTLHITATGSVETMDVTVQGLLPNTSFALFVTQVPKAPFGVSWYLGDIQTNQNGLGHERFIGRFSIETFVVAPGSAPAPIVFNGVFPEDTVNPSFNSVQMYHLGLWFGSPKSAGDAGCPTAFTPFNGQHNAGIQVMNTSNFPDDHGPLRGLDPSTGIQLLH
jgi:hypothetical protein